MLYRLVRAVGWFLFSILGLKVIGRENLPADGRVIVVANHNSNWDPLLIGFSFKRPICYMAKKSLFKYAWSTLLFNNLHAFPVERGTVDRQAIRKAMEVLEQEKVLGIFPEGERTEIGTQIKAKKGAALIAVRTRSPIVPIACIGTRSTFPVGWFRDLKIIVGTPIFTKEMETGKMSSALLESLSVLISDKIQLLLDESSRNY